MRSYNRSIAASSKCGQCHVDSSSRQRKLNTGLFKIRSKYSRYSHIMHGGVWRMCMLLTIAALFRSSMYVFHITSIIVVVHIVSLSVFQNRNWPVVLQVGEVKSISPQQRPAVR